MNELLLALLFCVGFNLLMFIPAYFFKTDKLTDISYALSFAVVALFTAFRHPITVVSALLLIVVLIWAVRLGSFLLIRIMKTGKDNRFDGRRENFLSFAGFWLLQGITVWVVLLPYLLYFNAPSTNQGFTLLSGLGLLFSLGGILIEGVADWQKFMFKLNPANKDTWIATGIWKYSRHPNYFGEIMMWVGVYLFVLSALTALQAFLALVSPAYITLLLLFVSGIPLLEKAADKKWGDNMAYREYKRTTSVLVPWGKRG